MIKKLYVIFFQIILTITIVDLFFLIILPTKIKNISNFYLNDKKIALTKGFPQNYFIKNSERGFDINKSSKIYKAQLPNEIEHMYDIFGNSNGCYDIERNNDNKKKIYLAGDSFTWGFVPYDKRFSSILDEQLSDIDVYNCGVPHTGQLHQFSKFKDIYKHLKNLTTVVINIYENDIENDYFFPHSKVIRGYLVDDKYWCIDNNKIKIIEKTSQELESKFLQNSIGNKIIFILAKYSASSNILYFTYKKIKKNIVKNNYMSMKCPKFSTNIYGLEGYKNDINGNFINNYIGGLQIWINHSKIYEYNLIFSIIPKKKFQRNEFKQVFKYLENQNIKVLSFEDYLNKNDIDKKNLYWDNDLHFNIEGHKIYAQYLYQNINK